MIMYIVLFNLSNFITYCFCNEQKKTFLSLKTIKIFVAKFKRNFFVFIYFILYHLYVLYVTSTINILTLNFNACLSLNEFENV